jgi:hypothetical protein
MKKYFVTLKSLIANLDFGEFGMELLATGNTV